MVCSHSKTSRGGDHLWASQLRQTNAKVIQKDGYFNIIADKTDTNALTDTLTLHEFCKWHDNKALAPLKLLVSKADRHNQKRETDT